MSPLNIHPEENVSSLKKKNNKILKVMLGIGALVLVPVIGTTLAGTINIDGNNGSGDAVFGQGIRSAVACDSDVLLKASARYVYGGYKLDKITVDGLDTTACANAVLELSSADNTDSDISELGLAEDNTPDTVLRATVDVDGTGNLCSQHTEYFSCDITDGKLTVTITNANTFYGINALDIYKLLIQEIE